jgi:hypothetical protein
MQSDPELVTVAVTPLAEPREETQVPEPIACTIGMGMRANRLESRTTDITACPDGRE